MKSFGKKNYLLQVPFFPENMNRNRFCKIMRFLRFDMRSTRFSRIQTDKFALILAVWDKFIKNSNICNKPKENTVLQRTNNYSQLKPAADLHNIWPTKWTKIKIWPAVGVKSK